MSEIRGNFVWAARPLWEDGAHIGWCPSLVRLSAITIIQENPDAPDTNCMVYTEKGDWYEVAMNIKHLLMEINDIEGRKFA